MPHSILYSIAGFGLLGHWSTASPLNIARPDSSSHNTGGNTVQAVSRSNGLHERQDLEVIGPTFEGRWPLQPLDFPFPANVSIHADTEASPNDMPPNIDPQNQDVEVLSRREISKAFIENSCSADQKAQVLAAWEEARDLAEAQTKIEYGFDYNTIHTNWLGVDWNSESSWIPWRKNFRKRNQDNWGRLSAMFSRNAPKNDYLYFYCTDWKNICPSGAAAYATSYIGHVLWWNNHYITFCPKWFKMKSLATVMETFKNDEYRQQVMENFQTTSGGVLFHEIWHLKNLVSIPQTADHAYWAQPVWDLAKNRGTWWATENADSYHLDAMAIYVQQSYETANGPVPFQELRTRNSEAFAAVQNDVYDQGFTSKYSVITWSDSDSPPEGGQRNPDGNKWSEITYDIWNETPREQPAPPSPTKSLSIVMDFISNVNGFPDLAEVGKLHWFFFQTNYGTGVDCRTDMAATFDQVVDITQSGPFYPTGNFGMALFGEDCEYQSGANSPGKLVCSGKDIQCIDDPADKNPSDPNADKGNYSCGDKTRQPVFLCSW